MPSFRDTLAILNQSGDNFAEAAKSIGEGIQADKKRRDLLKAGAIFKDNPRAQAAYEAAPESIRPMLLADYASKQASQFFSTKTSKQPLPPEAVKVIAGGDKGLESLLNKLAEQPGGADLQNTLLKARNEKQNFDLRRQEANSKDTKREESTIAQASAQYQKTMGQTEKSIGQANRILSLVKALKEADPNDPKAIKSLNYLRTDLAGSLNSMVTGKPATVYGMKESDISDLYTNLKDAKNKISNKKENTISPEFLDQIEADVTELKHGFSGQHANEFASFIESVPDRAKEHAINRFKTFQEQSVLGMANPYGAPLELNTKKTEVTGNLAKLMEKAGNISDPNKKSMYIEALKKRAGQNISDDQFTAMSKKLDMELNPKTAQGQQNGMSDAQAPMGMPTPQPSGSVAPQMPSLQGGPKLPPGALQMQNSTPMAPQSPVQNIIQPSQPVPNPWMDNQQSDQED